MFDIGFLEMMTIGIVALVVIGPERLPEVATKVGRYVGKAQRFVRGVRSDISRELETGDLKKLLGDQKDQIEELRSMVHSATKDIKSSTNEAMKDAENSIGDLKSDISAVSSDSSEAKQTNVVEPEQLNKPEPSGDTATHDTSQSQNDKAS